jgi:cytochrome c5
MVSCCALLGSVTGCGDEVKPKCSDGDSCSGGSQDSDTDDTDPPKGAGARDGGSGSSKSDASVKKDAAAPKDAGSANKGADLPCDVEQIVTKNCGTCHGEETAFGAPVSLTNPADFAATATDSKAQTMAELVKTRINATDVTKRMPPSPGKLSAAELKTLNDWLDDGAQGGARCSSTDKPSDAGVQGDPVLVDAGDPHDDPNLTCYKMLANSGDGKSPFAVGAVRDAYYNVVFAAPWKGTAYARVISPVIDNMKAIHHWLLFQDDVPGLPGAPVKGSGAHPAGQLIMGWAPGGPATDFRPFPDDLGFEMPGNTTYTVEFHYNSSDPFAKDASGAEICVSTTKPKNLVGLSWLGNDNLLIPSTTWTGTCAPTSQQQIHIVGVNPHMHLQGRHVKAIINRKDGKKETLQDSDFDFNYQVSYNKNVVLNPGDTITTTCTFAQPMTFGESTNAEMCYLFTLAYPYGALADLGGWGAIAHGGSSCLGM